MTTIALNHLVSSCHKRCTASVQAAYDHIIEKRDAVSHQCQQQAHELYCKHMAKTCDAAAIEVVVSRTENDWKQSRSISLHESLLAAWAYRGTRSKAGHVYGIIRKSWPEQMSVNVFNSMIFLDTRFGRDPSHWIKQMQKRNIKPNTETNIVLLCRLLAFAKTSELEKYLREAASPLPLSTPALFETDQMLPLLYCCYDMRNVKQAHVIDSIMKNDLQLQHSFLTAHWLLRTYGVCGAVEYAQEVIDRLIDTSLWDTVFTEWQRCALVEELMRAKCMNNVPEEAENDLLKLLADGIPPTQRMLCIIAAGYTASSNLDGVKSIFRMLVRNDFYEKLDEATVVQMLSSFAILRQPEECEKIFNILRTQYDYTPSHEAYGYLIEAHARRWGPYAAEERLLLLQVSDNLRPQLPELLALMVGYVSARNPEGCHHVFNTAVRSGLKVNHKVLCTLAKAYALTGDFLQVETVLYHTMREHDVRPRPSAFIHLINAYFNANEYSKLMDLILSSDIKHGRRTFQRAVSLIIRTKRVDWICEILVCMAQDMPVDRLVVKMCNRFASFGPLSLLDKQKLLETLNQCTRGKFLSE